MSDAEERVVIAHLSHALHKIRSTPPRLISSPATQPRRAAVAIVLRIVPPSQSSASYSTSESPSLTDFFKLDWVHASGARAEVLFLHREKGQTPDTDRLTKEAHVAFPGGRMEEGDENGLYTAMRQTWEEIGLDLAERDFICIGQLDDREITTSLGKRLLMILSPFVFLQVTPGDVPIDPPPETALHWIPVSTLSNQDPTWSHVAVDVASRLAPRHSWVKILVRILVGSMQFSAIVLNYPTKITKKKPHASATRPDRQLKLWGLTLGMTMDLLACMHPQLNTDENAPGSPTNYAFKPHPTEDDRSTSFAVAPAMTSVFPRFSYPDVNFWIWVFGKRYREVVRGWEASLLSGGSNNKRINWAGTALNAFYAAVRKALIVVIVLRAIGVLFALGFGAWWILRAQ
ncbi:hypothetical protein BU17DRAFT_81193 [Hysterangium stoloniferum]|nr:hypothetical protein BU17DRAFT_81193 [Hysterangium stoloniferum]